jgi:AmmeMemoRadiSam system protein B
MKLPFLQRLVPGLRIVPVLMGWQNAAGVEALAAALPRAACEGRALLLVASSDLSHYHPAERAARLDARVVECVEAFDPEELLCRLEAEPGHACGGGPVVAVMKAARSLGATSARVLRRADSGDEGPRDKSRVVGYLSAALIRGNA